MIDNLTEAIARAKEEAKEFRSQVDNINKYRREIETASNGTYTADIDACKERASKHEQLVAWLEELAERREADRWIPVSERLPDKDGIYLVTFFTGMFKTRLCATATYCLKYGWNMKNVIAWKPLPKPYESEDK